MEARKYIGRAALKDVWIVEVRGQVSEDEHKR
jgi:hypothetical protein